MALLHQSGQGKGKGKGRQYAAQRERYQAQTLASNLAKSLNIFVAWKNLQTSKAFSLSVQKSNI